jgi:hypothetical protein
MRRLGRFKPSPALVVASIALIVALGGTSYAALTLPPRSVTNSDLASGAVNSRVIQNHTVKNADLASGVIRQGPAGPRGAQGPPGAPGAAGAPGPSDGFNRFVNGPVTVSTGFSSMGSVSVPAGNYIAVAKAYFNGTGSGTAACKLGAGSENDQSQTFVSAGFTATVASVLGHQFSSSGSFDFQCAFAGTGTAQANHIEIAAVKVGTLTKTTG